MIGHCPTFGYCVWGDLKDLVEHFDFRSSVIGSRDAVLLAELSQDGCWLLSIMPYIVTVSGEEERRQSDTDIS